MAQRVALVTGVSGHVGRALAERLQAAGVQVRALVRTPAQAAAAASRGLEPWRGDLSEPRALRRAAAGAEMVVHSVGYRSRRTFEQTLQTLVELAAANSPALTR